MKKILTVLTSVLLLCAMALSMASCGVDMAELKTTLDGLQEKKEITYTNVDGDKTSGKDIVARYSIRSVPATEEEEPEYLYVKEYANAKLAKLAYKMEKLSNENYEDYMELQKKYNEELLEIGAEVEEIEEEYEEVLVRKGNVVISGSKALYEKIF